MKTLLPEGSSTNHRSELTKYKTFYNVVETIVNEIQEHVWLKSGKPKRRLKNRATDQWKMIFSME